MKILFCNIANMTYYKGIKPYDMPYGGGAYVEENYDGSDVNNFKVAADGTVHGFVMTRTLKDASHDFAQIRLERIDTELSEADHAADNVLVVWVAPDRMEKNRSIVVGWYREARIFRRFQNGEEGNYYNVRAQPGNVVLLPPNERQWEVPRASRGDAEFGMGQSNIWYADKPEAQEFVLDMVRRIGAYEGENWLNKDAAGEEEA